MGVDSLVGAVGHDALPWPHTDIPGAVEIPNTPPNPFDYTASLQDSVGIYLNRQGPAIVSLRYNDVVEAVLQNSVALDREARMQSWNLHGHKFYVVGMGKGTFDARLDPRKYNLLDPMRRDIVIVHPYGWTDVRFVADNPGVWLMCCTKSAHSVMGLGFNFVVSPDVLPRPPRGVYSCLHTSLDPNDAEVCDRDHQVGGLSGKSGLVGKSGLAGQNSSKRRHR